MMNELQARIDACEQELSSVEGSHCEVYARIVGYMRSVKNWNAGKKAEYNVRKTYTGHVGQNT